MDQKHALLSVVLVAVLFIGIFRISGSSIDTGRSLAATNCSDCHDFSDQKVNRKGPYLWGVYNRKAGTAVDYKYSEAFLQIVALRQAFSWTAMELDSLIADPARYMPGISMARNEDNTRHGKAFKGIQEKGKRTELIAYLRTLN